MKAYGRLDLVVVSVAPRGKSPGTHWIGGCVGPRAGLDDVKKILDPTGTRNVTHQSLQPAASHYTDYATRGSTSFICKHHKKDAALQDWTGSHGSRTVVAFYAFTCGRK
jgi:hypothetical protein